jgi:hypothetical protein
MHRLKRKDRPMELSPEFKRKIQHGLTHIGDVRQVVECPELYNCIYIRGLHIGIKFYSENKTVGKWLGDLLSARLHKTVYDNIGAQYVLKNKGSIYVLRRRDVITPAQKALENLRKQLDKQL